MNVVTKASWVGLLLTLALVVAAVAVPLATGWRVHVRADTDHGVAPLHALWDPKVGPGTVPALLLAMLGVVGAFGHAERLRWPALLLVSYAGALGWLLSLALVDGPSGITRALGNPDEYLRTARGITSLHDVHRLLETYVSRIPLHSAQHWPIHIAGHPPGMLLFFVALARLGLGGDLAAGLVVTALAATLPLAVLTVLRALDREHVARLAAPYLVLTPAAVWLAVSADAVMAVVVAWGLACLARAAVGRLQAAWPWAIGAGLCFGAAVMMSYGLPLAALLAVALLAVARRWWPVPIAAAVALAVVLVFAAAGFAWWHAYPVLSRRYWDGIAAVRPASYWLWGDLAALALSAGPLVGAGLGALGVRRREDKVVTGLVLAATLAVLLADASRMSKAEVERIWLPFVPWLTLAATVLPRGWRRPALAGQVATALLVQHLLYTSW